jgi:hypothetical protein
MSIRAPTNNGQEQIIFDQSYDHLRILHNSQIIYILHCTVKFQCADVEWTEDFTPKYLGIPAIRVNDSSKFAKMRFDCIYLFKVYRY